MLFQHGALFTDLNIYENVAFPLREHTDLPGPMIRDLVLMKLHAVGLRGAASPARSRPWTSTPSSITRPRDGLTWAPIARSTVVLPQPEPPINATSEPRRKRILMFFRIRRSAV